MNLLQEISKLSQNPGVYIFLNAERKIIYIGKATNLKSRVSSYFRNYKSSDRPIEMMIHEVIDIETQETESVLEALILEANLIKKHQPKYNVLGKDDKSYSYFIITKEDFPRVLIMRKTELGQDTKNKKQITKKSQIKENKQELNSKYNIQYTKIFGPYTSKRQMEIALKIMRKIFPFHSNKNKTEKGCLDFQLGRCPGPHAGVITKAEYAKNIQGLRMILEGKKQGLLKKMEKDMLANAKKEEFEKAAEIKKKIFALKHIHDVALMLDDHRDVPIRYFYDSGAFRIEAYDISNISGQYAVGSMIVFDSSSGKLESNKNEYRKFKIKTVDGSNDVGMMAEVLFRRFSRQDWKMPDLVFLDGGQGHLNMAQKVLKELGLEISLVAVAKGPTRKNLQLTIFNLRKDLENILSNKNLLKQIMDEAHRFAIGYHRKLRQKIYDIKNIPEL